MLIQEIPAQEEDAVSEDLQELKPFEFAGLIAARSTAADRALLQSRLAHSFRKP
jgi:hypothetical protein